MKKYSYFALVLLLFITDLVHAFEPGFLLKSKSQTVALSNIKLTDPYLSPLEYSGSGFRYMLTKSSLFSPVDTSMLWQNNLCIRAGVLYNPTKSATMTLFGGNYSWGAYFYLKPFAGFKVLVGGVGDVELSMRNIARNINNPVNVDLATNLNVGFKVLYNRSIFKRNIGFQLNAQSPLVGYMFVPQGGASYYEMFLLNNLSGSTHFSSLHNKRALKTLFTVDVPFNKFTCRMGVGYETMKYVANDMLFRTNDLFFSLGFRYDLAVFSGKKIKYPSSFKSSGL